MATQTTLSNNAVELMVKGSPLESPLTVEAYPIEGSPNHVWLCDGKRNCIAALWLFPTPLQHAVTVRVKGYVSSGSNAAQTDPLVAVGDVDHLTAITTRKPMTKKYSLTQNCRVQGGQIPSFLRQLSGFLTLEELAGSSIGGFTWNEKLRVVADFFSLNRAMNTLHAQSPNTSTELFVSVLNEFQQSQWERQASSLTSNAGRESSAVATKIKSQHKNAMEHALNSTNALSMAKLNVIHSFLCDGLIEDAGLIRRKNVRVGMTSFCPHEEIAQKMIDAISTLATLDAQVIQQHQSQQDNKTILAVLVYAAATLLTILDIHPYADGNGRLARICMNWALSVKGQFPFLVHLFATPTQRQNYVDAIRKTRRNFDVKVFGSANSDTVRHVHQISGCLFPMVDLILDRLHKAVTECNRMLSDKRSQTQEDEEAQAARRFRERAAAGSCLICFEENPNIATLCCGKAVHLNCMAEWLSGQSSCPQCRADLPSIPERMRRSDSNESAETEEADLDISHTTEDDTDSTHSAALDDTTTEEVEVRMDSAAQNYENDTTTEDDTMTASANTADDTTMEEDTTNDTTDDTSTSDTEEDDDTQQASSHHPPACTFCNNRSARDCSNTCCGRCCLLHGWYNCERHN